MEAAQKIESSPRPTALTKAVLALFVVLLAVACYYNTLAFGFVNWDDNKLIVDNPYIRGLTYDNLKHIWTEPILETYLPLRATSYAVDYHFWGLVPAGYHLTNVLLHAVSSLLVFFIVSRLAGSVLPAVFAGALFAVHPVHTEAVAWASGRKDVLSTALFLAAYFLYLVSIDGVRRRWWAVALSVFAFLLSGLAKAMVVTLPVLIVLTDVLYVDTRGGRWKRLVPFWGLYFAAAAVTAYVAVHFAASAGAIRPYHFGSAAKTALFMTWAVLHYLKIMFFPDSLSARYPYGDTNDFGVNDTLVYLSPVALLVILAAVAWLVMRAARTPKSETPAWIKLASLGAAWFLITLLPVLNVVSINVLVADRYLYLPSAGFLLALAAVFWWLWREGLTFARAGVRRWVTLIAVSWIVMAGAVFTGLHNEAWRTSLSLWGSVVAEFPKSVEARLLLAAAYGDAAEPDYKSAIGQTEIAETLAPDSGAVHLARGQIFSRMGQIGKAQAEFEAARRLGLEGSSDVYESFLAQAAVEEKAGNIGAAAELLQKAIAVDAGRPEGYNNLGRLRQAAGDLPAAEALYVQATKADPRFARAWYNLGVLSATRGDARAAAGYYSKAIEADPTFAEAMANLAVLYLAAGDASSAAPLLESAIATKGDVAAWHVTLATAYAALDNAPAVRRELQTALKIDPGNEIAARMLEKLNAMTEGGK